ncbi:hypothetical protein D3C81_2113650 [compost metagenome]
MNRPRSCITRTASTLACLFIRPWPLRCRDAWIISLISNSMSAGSLTAGAAPSGWNCWRKLMAASRPVTSVLTQRLAKGWPVLSRKIAVALRRVRPLSVVG